MMMMIKDDEDDNIEAEDESDTKDSDSEEKERVEKERVLQEQEEVRYFLRETLLELADNVVKTAMTGTVLFALRFDQSEEEYISSDDDY